MQHMWMNKSQRDRYHSFLQSDHDFDIWAEVLTLEENHIPETSGGGQVVLLDGQVNLSDDDGPERTCTLTISDLEHALSFGSRIADDETGTIWVNRLVRVQHRIAVPDLITPGVASEVISTPFIGVPTSAARDGGEVGLELGDKSLLMDHGVKEKTYKKGWDARNAIVDIIQSTGEQHYHIPVPKKPKKLRKPYTVGMKDANMTPWRVARRIARKELGWRLEFQADGKLVAEPLSASRTQIPVDYILDLPSTSVDLTGFGNYVKVTSKRKQKKIVSTWEGIATLPAKHELSLQSLARNGKPRFMPLVVEDDSLKSKKQVDDRAQAELRSVSGISSDQSYSVIPMFHLDNHDHLLLPLNIGVVPFDIGSIPLATGGSMTVGDTGWVSRPVTVKRKRIKTRHHVRHIKQKKDDHHHHMGVNGVG